MQIFSEILILNRICLYKCTGTYIMSNNISKNQTSSNMGSSRLSGFSKKYWVQKGVFDKLVCYGLKIAWSSFEKICNKIKLNRIYRLFDSLNYTSTKPLVVSLNIAIFCNIRRVTISVILVLLYYNTNE